MLSNIKLGPVSATNKNLNGTMDPSETGHIFKVDVPNEIFVQQKLPRQMATR